jgi:hypothetical protein
MYGSGGLDARCVTGLEDACIALRMAAVMACRAPLLSYSKQDSLSFVMDFSHDLRRRLYLMNKRSTLTRPDIVRIVSSR